MEVFCICTICTRRQVVLGPAVCDVYANCVVMSTSQSTCYQLRSLEELLHQQRNTLLPYVYGCISFRPMTSPLDLCLVNSRPVMLSVRSFKRPDCLREQYLHVHPLLVKDLSWAHPLYFVSRWNLDVQVKFPKQPLDGIRPLYCSGLVSGISILTEAV